MLKFEGVKKCRQKLIDIKHKVYYNEYTKVRHPVLQEKRVTELRCDKCLD